MQELHLYTSGSTTVQEVLPNLLLTEMSEEQMRNLARSITVKVLTGGNSGSGILIRRQGDVYTVLTNQHVLRAGTAYRIKTPNGQVYSAFSSGKIRFGDNDLALLHFRSQHHDYAIASLGTAASLRVGDQVLAAGFPFAAGSPDSMNIAFTGGQVSLLLDQALVGGYQVGYSNEIQKGMSGGPLLNRQGEVVGINGMHKYPLWGDPYLFKDGSKPDALIRVQMVHLSWGIPMETICSTDTKVIPSPCFVN